MPNTNRRLSHGTGHQGEHQIHQALSNQIGIEFAASPEDAGNDDITEET
jgi:hypothetical protein